MDVNSLLKQQIEMAHGIVEGTAADLTQEMCDNIPGGKAHPIGATYAHIVMSEDFIVNMIIRGSTPLAMSSHAGKTGASEPPPMPGGDTFAWANRVKVDMGQAREYAQAVYKNTLDYVDSLAPSELEREIDVPGFGKNPLSYYVSIATIVHPSNHIGEVSAMKGILGARGYPF